MGNKPYITAEDFLEWLEQRRAKLMASLKIAARDKDMGKSIRVQGRVAELEYLIDILQRAKAHAEDK